MQSTEDIPKMQGRPSPGSLLSLSPARMRWRPSAKQSPARDVEQKLVDDNLGNESGARENQLLVGILDGINP